MFYSFKFEGKKKYIYNKFTFQIAHIQITKKVTWECLYQFSYFYNISLLFPDYAEPDVVAGGQMMGLTFRPPPEEGYTVPFSLNHYDTPGQLPEYTDPLPPEPEYATPFSEMPTDSTLNSRQLCRSTQAARAELSQQQYDCPAHRVISNGYCTPVLQGTSQHKASVIYFEPQTVEPLLHTYHEPL